MMQSRTHTCGQLRLANAGENVTLAGWLENVREVGANFAFLVLRDYYGTTQVVIENEEMMSVIKPLNKESTISVTGTVRERESKNTKIPTGEIEVVLALTLPDSTGNGDGGLLVQGLDDGHHGLVLDDHLGGAVVVTQDAESKVGADLTDILQPADDGDLFTCVSQSQLAAVMCSGLHHKNDPLLSII